MEKGKINCVLCGYCHEVDNSGLFINRVMKVFGYYTDVIMDRSTIEKELFKEELPKKTEIKNT